MADLLEHLGTAVADRYRVDREIGRGGMAYVFLAQDVKLDRPVALKVLRPDLAAELGGERFLREIEVTAQLRHPMILPLLDSGEADGLFYYVMPFVEGESLRDRLSRERQLPIEDALQITKDVAEALGYAHSRGVIHRDIKPENILLDSGHALVADFGIAKAVTDAGGGKLTETGVTIGTPAYMSPEQATATQDLDGRTDLYSLGCVLYEMLTGETPYGGPTPMAVVAKKLSEPLPRASVVREAIPPGVEAALTKALAKTPADRFRTAEQFAAALDASPSRFSIRRKSVRLPVAVVAAALLLVAGALVMWKLTRPFTVTASNLRQVTFDPGIDEAPALSPDGSEVAFRRAGTLFVQPTQGGTPLRLAVGGGPSWSPDGDRIRFSHADTGATFGFFEVGRLGGPVRVLDRHRGAMATLSPDGRRFVGFMHSSPDTVEISGYAIGRSEEGKELWARSGGFTGKLGPYGFAWSPDGRRIAYPDDTDDPAEEWRAAAIWVVLEAGAEPIRVTDDEHHHANPVWMPDNRHLLFVSNRDGPRDIYMVDVEKPGEPRRVTFGGQDPRWLSLSADGKRLAFAKYRFRRNIWAVRVSADRLVSMKEARPVTAVGWGQRVFDHDLSPDGDTLAYEFRADPRGKYHIYKMAVDGTQAIQLTDDSVEDYAPRWSPSGKEIVFGRETPAGTVDVWVMDADGGNQRRVMENRRLFSGCDWSPDGLQIVCGEGIDSVWAVSRDSVRQGFDMPVDFGERTLWYPGPCSYVRRIKGGNGFVCNQLWEGGFQKSFAWLSASGQFVRRFEATPWEEASRRWNAVIRGNADEEETRLLWWVRQPRVSPDGSTLYFFANPGGAVFVMSMPADGSGVPRRAVTFEHDPSLLPMIPGNGGENEFAPVTVGRGVLYFSVGESESDIWVADLDW